MCPMTNPGPAPHQGGPAAMGAPTVLIGGQPAARMDDVCICSGPPDTVASGAPTVLIGSGAGSGGEAGSGGDAAVQGAKASAAMAMEGEMESTNLRENWIEVEFVDAAGYPVSGVPYELTTPGGSDEEDRLRLDGTVRREQLKEGQAAVTLKDVYEAAWAKKEARPDETVSFSAKVDGFEDGTPATVQVLERGHQGTDAVVDEMTVQVEGGQVEGEWTYVYPWEEADQAEDDSGDDAGSDDEDRSQEGYSAPQYYVEIRVENCTARSGLLKYQDYIEIKLKDYQGEPVSREPYVVTLPNGDIRKGTLDAQGYAKEESVPPGRFDLRFPDTGDVYKK